MKLIRKKCVICNSGNLNVFLDYQMPVYSSDVLTSEDHQISDIKFSECSDCNSVQLKYFVEPEIVYQYNHNREVIGEIWQKHYDEFFEFIGDVQDKIVLEISDPSAKLAKKFTNYFKWFIVEPHSNSSMNENNIFFIDEFFDDGFQIDEKIDMIVHSHFFEHTLEPLSFLNKCNELLEEGGLMYVSTPNLYSILSSLNNPNNVLHFEHTFYFDKDILNYLANKSGFEIQRIYEFRNHSLFLELKKIKNKVSNSLIPKFKKSSDLFLQSYNKYKKLIDSINLSGDRYILFGCHISSQFLIYNGLNTKKIDFIIDNSFYKQNKYLYGTDILTYSPSKILESDDIVIVSHMGVYADEIKKGLLKIKKNIKFI